MAKIILGSYQEEDDAVNAINAYELKGHSADKIHILTNESKRELKRRTDVHVTSMTPNNKSTPSITDKVKRIFINHTQPKQGSRDLLLEFGLSEEQVEECLAKIRSGETIVIADDTLKLGHTKK